jgi:hypothetical protein
MSALELSSLPPAPLTVLEVAELDECEADITLAHDAVIQARKAMARIRGGKLYRATHSTFEAYCEERWDFSARHGHRLADEATVAFNVTHGSQLPAPESGRALRALSLVPDEEQPDVWAEAVAANGGVAATGRQIENIVALRRDAQTEAPPDSSGERLPVSDITASGHPPLGDEDEHAAAFMQDFRDRRDAGAAPSLTLGTAIAPIPRPGGHPENLHANESIEWFTPEDIIAAAREVMGAIELDPASCEQANGVVRATNYFTSENDGLTQEWHGRVWMNPPYGKDDGESNQARWLAKLIGEFQSGRVTEACAIFNSSTSDSWFGALWDFTLCFTRNRVKFWRPGEPATSPRYGSVIVYMGPNPAAFAAAFGHRIGAIARRWEV